MVQKNKQHGLYNVLLIEIRTYFLVKKKIVPNYFHDSSVSYPIETLQI